MPKITRLLSILALSTATLALAGATAPSAGATTLEFTESTAWQVPEGVTCVTFDVIGARGGDGGTLTLAPTAYADGAHSSAIVNGGPGGFGGEVQVELGVAQNNVLAIFVGERGGDGSDAGVTAFGGGNGGNGEGAGGGGGGGASSVEALSAPLLLAAGGGGGGAGYDDTHVGGAGGIDEQDGSDGGTPPSDNAATGGEGAIGDSGGAAGANSTNDSGGSEPTAGTEGQGGNGGSNGDGGGGGGDGLVGGGGGGAGWVSGGAGGGGGSNFAPPWADVTHGVDADNGGNGKITVSYTVGDVSCLAAPLTVTKSVVGGDVAPDTRVTVTIACDEDNIDPETVGGAWYDDGLPSASLDFVIDAAGAVHPASAVVGFFGPTSCTVTETLTAGAVRVTYECTSTAGQGGDAVGGARSRFVGAAAVDPGALCSTGGPTSTPVTVDIVEPDQSATVSVANEFPVQLAEEVEIQPTLAG